MGETPFYACRPHFGTTSRRQRHVYRCPLLQNNAPRFLNTTSKTKPPSSCHFKCNCLSAWADDSYQHIRNANGRIGGRRFLIDPFFSPKHSMNGFCRERSITAKMPLVGAAMSVNKISDGGCSYRYPYSRRPLGRNRRTFHSENLPVYVQHQADAAKIRSIGFTDVRVERQRCLQRRNHQQKNRRRTRYRSLYANPQLAEILGDAIGVFQSSGHKTAYIMGDTVWMADVNKALNRYKPDYLIMNTGYALISGISDGIIMGTADVLKPAKSCLKPKSSPYTWIP